MKNFLFIYLFITLSIVVNSCEEGFKSENSDESSVFTLALKEVTAVPSLTTDNTPDYTFSSNIAGSITYGGLCSSSTTVANQGNNTITLDPLSNGTYSDCTITVDTEGPWLIGSLTLSSFIVEDPTSPTIAEVTVVTTPTNDSTPNYTFSSDQAGTITYGGSCSSSTTSAFSGNNPITLNSLNDGTYSDCTIKVTNASGYVSDSITITSFVVDSTAATLAEVTAVTTLTNDSTPEYTFSSDQAGTITYGGSCSSVTTSANSGNTTITLISLSDGPHSDCTVTVTDPAGNSVTLNMSSFTIDTTAPFVSSFFFYDTLLKTGDNTVVYLNFSEEVASFSSDDDIRVANGNLAAMTSNNNINWSGIFTPTANTQDWSNWFNLNDNYTDTVGNTGTAATTANYMVDDNDPSVDNFTLSDTALKAGDNAEVTLVFSEAVASFSSDEDITADNGTLTAMTSSDDITWTGTFTPTADTEGASNTLSLTANSYTDIVGNTGPSATTANYEVDTLVPSVSNIVISSATGIQNNFLNAGDNVSVTSTFSENVLVTNTPQLTLVVGVYNRTATYTSGDNSTTLVFQYTIQPLETDTDGISIGADVLALNSGTIRDAAGNNATLTHNAVSDNASYKVDATSPTANFTKAYDNEGTVTGDFTSDNTTDDTTLVLSGTNEAESSVMVYNGSTELGAATVSGTSWSYSATVANGTTYQFNVRETDPAGNTSAATSNLAVTGDTTAPTAPSVSGTTPTIDTTPTWSWNSGGGGGNGIYRYKLDNSDLTSGATETTSTSYTPGSGISEASHILYVQERDEAGNWSSAGSRTIVIDTTAPTAPSVSGTTPTIDTTPTWSWNSGGGGGNGTYRYKLDNSDLTSGATETTSTSYTPGSGISEASHILYVQERDEAGQWSSSGSRTIIIDTTAPTAPSVSGTTPTIDTTPTWSWNSGGGGGNGTYRYKLDNSDLTSGATETTSTSYTPGSGISEASHILYVQERDEAGNWSSAGSRTIVIDTTAPTAPSVSGTTPTNDTTPTWSWNSGGGGDNGTYRYKLDNSDLTSGATETETASYTPGSGISEASHILYVQERDEAGNWSSAGSRTIVIDTTAPTVSGVEITDGAGKQNNFLNVGDNVSVTVTFSENSPVTGTPQLTLAVGEDNHTATYASSGSGGTTLVFTYTIQAGDTDSNGISIRADALALDNGTIMDLAENNAILTHSVVDNNSSYKVDTTAPSVDNFTLSDTALKIGDNATVTLEFSEAVIDFIAADITADNGTLPAMASEDNTTWEGTFTPTDDTEEDNNRLSLATSYTDLAGNAGPAETTANYAIDTLLPTISSVTAGWGAYLNATEDNSAGTVTVVTSGAENDQTVTVTLNSTNYTGTVSDNSTSVTFAASVLQALADGDNYTLTTNVSDAAGNAATVNTGTLFTYDRTPPSISGAVAITDGVGDQNNFLNATDVVSVTVTFSENSTVTGTPQLTLAVGEDNHTADYTSSGSGDTTKVFKYTIQAGDNDTNGISIRANALALNSGTIMDLAENNAILTHSVVDNNSSYMVDTEAPRVDNFTLSDTALKIGDNATVTLVFSEAVISFSAATITNPNGTLPSMTSNDNITWTGTFTPTADTEEDNNTLSLANSYTDLAGNAGPSETTANYAIDTLLPTISSVTAGWGTYLNATEDDSAGTVTVVTSGAEDNQTITVTLNGTNYTGTVSDNSTAVTVAASGLQALTDGSIYTLTTNVSDAAGNAATVNTGPSFTYDRTPPSISGAVAITGAGIQNNFLNVPDVVSATVTFSEVVNKTGTPQLTLAVGSDNRTATYASGTGYAPLVFTYTIQTGDNDTNGISIRANALALNSGTIMDLAENNAILTHSAVSDNNSYMVDTEAPRVDNFTLSDTALKIGDNATVNLGFSEAVIEFTAADITNPNGTLPSMISSDNITWTGTFTPTAGEEEPNNTLSLATSYTDLAGNAGPSETTANYEVETMAPTVNRVEITSGTVMQNNFLNASDAAGGDVLTLSVIFREPVIIDNASSNPTLTLALDSTNPNATYTSSSGATMVFQYTIRAGDTDTNGISIGANALALNNSTIRDTAGNYATNLNHDTVTNNSSYKVDTTPPTVSGVAITSGTGMLNDFLNHPTDVVSATVTFSENVSVTGTPQLTLAVGEDNNTADYTSSGSGATTTKVFKYTIQAGDNDTNGISIGENALALNSGTISDLAGNYATITHIAVSSNNRFMVDTEAPRVDNFTIDDALLTIGDNATVDLEFSEAVIGFTAADITNPNGSLPSMSSSDSGINWTGTFTPNVDTEVASNTLSLGINSYTDLAGNNGPAETTSNYEVETLAPSGTFSFTDYLFESGDTATVTLVFNEVVVDFSSADDITVPPLDNGNLSGALAAMTSSDNITWSSTFTPTFPNTQDWDNTLSLGTNYTDVDNNPGTAATSLNYMIDDIDPSTSGGPTLTLSRPLLLYGQTAELMVVFPEPVTSSSFSSADDINLDNATGSLTTPMTSSDNITWTGTFTPTTNVEVDNNTITLAASWTDQVGNPGTSVTTSNFEVDTKRPEADNFTFSVTDNTTYNGSPYNGYPALKPGDNATLTVVFSEPVVSFISADISNPKVVLDNMTSSDNITWTGTFTPMDDTQLSRERLRLYTSYNDIKGNPGIGKYSLYYVVDTRAPSVSSLQLTDGVTTLSTFTVRCLPVHSNIIVNFDYSYMEPSYITTSTSDTYCAGSIQVSSDNFSSCVRMSSEPTASSNLNKTFTLDPYDNLSYNTTYKVRVTTGVKDVLGNSMSSQYDSSVFKTSSYPSSSPISGVFVGVGQYGKEVRSIDNGTSWDNETCQILTDLYGVTSGNNTFVAVGESGKILRSTDNGSSFSTVSPYYVENSYGVTFGNNTFVGVSNSGRTGRSTDNGTSFISVNSNQSNHLYGVTFGNNTFVAVSSYRKTVRSTNDGSTWSYSNTPYPYRPFYGVTFGNNNFVAVGQYGKIVRSTDNGSTWSNSNSGISSHLKGVTSGNNTFVAVGESGKILRSTDNGATWNIRNSGISTHLNGVTFGNNTFVAVGSSGVILRSTDNGSSWNNSTSPITTDLNGVTFSE